VHRYSPAPPTPQWYVKQNTATDRVANSYHRNNANNVTRWAPVQKNHYWDDCGVLDIKQGRVAYRTFVQSDKSLSIVKLVNALNGAYCKQEMTDKGRHRRPLGIQPPASDIVTLNTYYATLKGHPEYKKHVTWLVHSPHVPRNASYDQETHANACRQTGEFVWTKPVVLDNVRQGLKRKNTQP